MTHQFAIAVCLYLSSLGLAVATLPPPRCSHGDMLVTTGRASVLADLRVMDHNARVFKYCDPETVKRSISK